MSKSIEMTARATKNTEADLWVEEADEELPLTPVVKPKRLIVDIEPSIHTDLKVLCARRGTQIADSVRSLIDRELRTDLNEATGSSAE